MDAAVQELLTGYRAQHTVSVMFETRRIGKLLTTAPGPSPWYLRASGPRVQTAWGQGRWVEAGNDEHTAGKMLLQAEDKTLAIVSMYNYALAVDGTIVLFWSQVYVSRGNTAPVHMTAIDCRQLVPLDDPRRMCADLPQGAALKVASGITGEIDVPTTEIGDRKVSFPSPISDLDEILILARSSGVDGTDGAIWNECLIVAKPDLGYVEVIPQDWFNKGQWDFGWQWPTRVARDPKTGHIVGDGIRMGVFMLDESCRNVQRWLRMQF
jgi:hypothetical protein